MPQPVVHFEVVGRDPARLRSYFGELFGWEFEVPSPVAQEVSESESYGFLNTITAEDGTGIPGGVGGGSAYESHAVFYVGVPDVGAALQRAEELGGTRVMGPATSPNWSCRRTFQRPRGHTAGRCWSRIAPIDTRHPPGGTGTGRISIGDSKAANKSNPIAIGVADACSANALVGRLNLTDG